MQDRRIEQVFEKTGFFYEIADFVMEKCDSFHIFC